ncbi:hypothetical protein ARMGADRAFT_950922 [Armillaria gallica]|uniref:Uncharacterized protein n=1 Tax=Armillaria gallica TaxID=47427 RepID=A0A2H3CRN2_ARMGA|nr:hypothetical protein ARMGADRAFT_950919 [Armillaria gallica]PBK79397.1 hypothetical protein ARMGADRAFT_950922 [Armillaria gallica]
MTNTASPPVWICKTHKNDAMTAALQALPFGDRLEKNADIEAWNEARCTTHFNHSQETQCHCKDGSDLKPRILGTQQQVSFNQILYDTDNAHIHIPLPFFTNKSLQHIDVKASVLPVQKANPPDNEKKAYNVLKIDELKPILGEELSMDYGLHAEAMGNFYHFQKSRDPLGLKGSHAAWYELHLLL